MTEFARALAARQLADYRSGTPGTFFADAGTIATAAEWAASETGRKAARRMDS